MHFEENRKQTWATEMQQSKKSVTQCADLKLSRSPAQTTTSTNELWVLPLNVHKQQKKQVKRCIKESKERLKLKGVLINLLWAPQK